MRVLFCSRRFFPAISGMSVYALNLLSELVAAGHEVTMVSQYRGDPAGTRVYGGGPPPDVPGVRVIGRRAEGEETGGDFERDVDDLVATIVAEHARTPFDVLHAQYGYPNGWAVVLAGQRLGVPTVVSIQGGDGHWVGSCCETHQLAMVRVLQGANAVLIGCESFRDEVVERLGVDASLFTLVPGAVDTAQFRPADDHVPGAAAGAPRLLYHGRVDRRKGALDFLDALAPLPAASYQATISGIGPDLDEAKLHAEALGLEVRFSGYAPYEDAPARYREADVFVSPTYAEGFSNTVLEAMASGLPIVSCDAVGVRDCLRHDDNALLVQPGDVAALTAALSRLLADQRLRARLSATALEECRRVYSWPAVAGLIMAAYARVAGQPPGRIDAVLPMTECRFRAAPHLL
jgi:glycogen(starch) synthase